MFENPDPLVSWRTICAHVNQLAVGSSLAALSRRGVLAALPSRVSQMQGLPGYLHGLFRALDSLAWVERGPGPDPVIQLTEEGRQVATSPTLSQLDRLWGYALDWAEGDFSAFPADPGPSASLQEAYLVGPLMLACLSRATRLPVGGEALLERIGWRSREDWTAAGNLALQQAPIYHYPLTYLNTLAQAEQLLFGDARKLRSRASTGEENHLDRRRDVLFSGQVFTGSVAPLIWEVHLPLLRSVPVLVDLGCGDARMLAEIGRRAPQARLVGVEYNPVARAVARETLQGAPEALVLAGDIADPAGICADLEAHGIALEEVLFLTKSVIHNRPWRAPRGPARAARSTAAAADPEGNVIEPQDLEQNLREFFADWRPWLRGAGWLVIEAHLVPCPVARAHRGRSLAPALELTHCYSGQLLVEAEVHRECAREAGLVARASHELGAATFGHPHMTVDHFVSR